MMYRTLHLPRKGQEMMPRPRTHLLVLLAAICVAEPLTTPNGSDNEVLKHTEASLTKSQVSDCLCVWDPLPHQGQSSLGWLNQTELGTQWSKVAKSAWALDVLFLH